MEAEDRCVGAAIHSPARRGGVGSCLGYANFRSEERKETYKNIYLEEI
jgi:hypothetical protein